MIRLPNSGLIRSVHKHNSDSGVVSDWIAASIAAGEETLSRSDVLDVLIEQQIYDDQDLCNEFLSDVWHELRRRHTAQMAFLEVESGRATPLGEWTAHAEVLFPILLSLGPRYQGWSDEFGDYVEQGRLFERLVIELVDSAFKEWHVVAYGWSAGGDQVELADAVADLGSRLRCMTRDEEIHIWAGAYANDAGLDFALFRKFTDGRGAYPAFLGQIASGRDWVEKLKQPDLSVWTKLLSFVSQPQRAVVIPHVLDKTEFNRRANQVEGLLIDRLRLFDGLEADVISPELKECIAAWVEPRLQWLAA